MAFGKYKRIFNNLSPAWKGLLAGQFVITVGLLGQRFSLIYAAHQKKLAQEKFLKDLSKEEFTIENNEQAAVTKFSLDTKK